MVSTPTLYGKPRKLSTNGYLKQMKRDGWIPAVIYSKESESQNILLESKELKRTFTHTGTRGVFMLQIEGEKTPIMALIRELQKNPIGDEYIHIDFSAVKEQRESEQYCRYSSARRRGTDRSG